jgi:hypothetical protein
LTSATSSGRTQCTRGEHERRAEAAATRRRDVERHLVGRQRLQPAPESFKLGGVDAGAGAAGIDQQPVRIVVGEQQRAEPWAPAFGIGPADHEPNPNPSNSAAFTTPARCQADSDNGLILDSLSRMFAVVNPGPDDLGGERVSCLREGMQSLKIPSHLVAA